VTGSETPTDYVRTVRAASLVYGADEPPDDDPAEVFHEASKLYPAFVARQTRGELLERHLGARVSTVRAVKRSRHLPGVELPDPAFPPTPFGAVIDARRSERAFSTGVLTLSDVATLLHAAYGTTHTLDVAGAGTGPPLRTVPSGGGLFPLEIYGLPWRVDGLTPGLYHFDPLRRVLERLRDGDLTAQVAAATVYDDVATGCGILLLVTAMFWRTRFKYALRGYRFALIEAGHVAQNVLLTSTALGLASVPLGGFFDRRVDELLGIDGVNESTVYAVAVGRREAST
jgi:SagB-type dehydrogenase family enzyme